MDGIVVYNTPHLLPWDWRIAVDLFFGGIGVGAFVVAALNSLYYKDKYPSVSKVGAVLSPLFVILGLVFLVSELGQPLRMWRTVTGFNVSSPLSWAGPFQGLFIVIGIVYAALWLRPGPSKARTALAVIGLPFAVVVGGYHGWLLTIVKARPLWNTGPATIAALLGFATTGIAAVLLVLCFMPKRKGANGLSEVRVIRNLRDLLLAGLILQGLTFFVWWVSLYFGSAYDREALAGANAATGPLFWSVGIGVGLVIPAVLEIGDLVLRREGTRPVNVQLTALAAVLILVGGLAFRYSVLIGGLLS